MSDPDTETLQLITSLLIDTVQELSTKSKGKYATLSTASSSASSILHDNEIAIDLFSQYLQELQTVQEDRRYAESISRAVETDQEVLLQYHSTERVERSDHEIALRLSGFGVGKRDTLDERVRFLDRRGACQAGPSNAGSSVSNKVPAPCPKPDICAICMEKQTVTYKVLCGHVICVGCLTRLYSHASNDETLVPVRCCNKPIDDNLGKTVIDPSIYARYKLRRQETVCLVKLYCPKPKCGSFIPATEEDKKEKAIKICPLCQELVCAVCRAAAHEGKCVNLAEGADRLFAEKVNIERWQTCYSCRRVVERTQDVRASHAVAVASSVTCAEKNGRQYIIHANHHNNVHFYISVIKEHGG